MQVLRDGQWQERDATILVPGDIISIKLGDIIPADARLLEGDPLKIDQASAFYRVKNMQSARLFGHFLPLIFITFDCLHLFLSIN